MNELQPIETEVAGQRALFDYAALDAETRIVVQQRAGEIKSIAKRMAADVVEIGEKLADVKQRLGANGCFNDWLSAELGWSPRTAHNFIGVWRRFGSANFAIENVAVSALYALAAPSTPAEAVEEVKRIVDRGQEVTNTVAKEIIEKAKATRPKQSELVEAVAPSTICLCGCKAGDHVRNGRYLECTNCECEIFQEASAEEIVERNTVEKALGITPSKRIASGPASTPTPETIARLKAEMELEESDDHEKASGEHSTEFFARPAGWFNSPIEIRITLLPGGDAETRKIQYAVRDAAIQFRAAPLTAEDYGEDTLLRLLPDAAYKLVEQLAAEWGKNQWSDAAKKRLKAEAIARWRREPVEIVELDEENEIEAEAEVSRTDDGTPALIELPLEEINRIAALNNAGRLGENKPLKAPAYVDGHPYLITGAMGSGDAKNYQKVWAYQVMPPYSLTAKKTNQRTYAEAKAEYYKRREEDDDYRGPFSYHGVKVNCGTKGKPDEWVMVGPEVAFVVDYAAAYPDDEIDAPLPEEEGDYQAEWLAGLSQEEREKYENAPCRCGHAREWHNEDERTGEYTRECTALNCGKTSPVERCTGYHCAACDTKGGHQATCKHYILGEGTAVQQVTEIAPQSPQLNEHGVYVKGVKKITVPMPKKAGKVEVVIHLVQDLADKMWRSSHSVSAGNGSASSLPSKRSEAFESRELALQEACANARVFLVGHSRRSDATDAQKRQIEAAIPALDEWGAINTVDHCADYPNDEIEADPEEVDLPQPNEPTIEDALHHALHHVQNAAERWKPLQYAGADDHELMRAIAFEFVGQGGSSQNGGWSVKGGKSPQFTWKRDGSTLKGKRLLAKVREALQIGPPIPAETAPADADDFTAPRCSECGRIDGAHTPECSQSPHKLTFEDYLAYAEFTKPKAPSSWARKWMLSREMDGTVLAWRLHWKELEDSGVTPFLQLCKCGHPLPKHKPEVGCDGKIDDQECQCVKFVDSAKAEEPKRAEKGRAA